jgi:uncharacterized membrane protein
LDREARTQLIRATDGEAAVLPTGLLISLAVVLLLLYTGWRGWEMVYRHRVAIVEEAE